MLTFKFKQILENNEYLKNNYELIDFFLNKMEVMFYNPFDYFIKQNDKENKNIFILGDGIIDVMKNFNNLRKDKIAEVGSGAILNEVPALFERASAYSYRCKSYSTLAKINFTDFRYVL